MKNTVLDEIVANKIIMVHYNFTDADLDIISQMHDKWVAEEAEKAEEAVQTGAQSAQPTYAHTEQKRSNRSQLLCAFKPYVSGERAKAIDSMLAIADILDMMRAR